ncbi:MAG: hypothetical protein KC435_06675 [Thermomicrobiales bacterium]|nr:hypothetical protein [Thermomicrobiales bacterium]
MSALLICFRHEDVVRWHGAFLENREIRRAYGGMSERMFVNAAHPDEVWVLIDWDDAARAHLYARSDDLIDLFDQEGVTTETRIWLLKELADSPGDYTIPCATEGGDPPDDITEDR